MMRLDTPSILFVHGWGFDAGLWHGVRDALNDCTTAAVDLGYFGQRELPAPPLPAPPMHTHLPPPLLCVGHSFGVMWLLRHWPEGAIGLVAVNGFAHFTGDRASPPRLVDRMLARLETQPRQVLEDFRARCGAGIPPLPIHRQRLAEDLRLLRDADERAAARALRIPILSLQGGADPILPASLRDTAFDGCDAATHITLPGHGHLLPMTAPVETAAHIRAMVLRAL